MNTVTIPQKLAQKGDLVVIPRKEYEEFLEFRETAKQFREFVPTSAQKKDLTRARADYRKGRYLTLHELKRKLAARDKRKGVRVA